MTTPEGPYRPHSDQELQSSYGGISGPEGWFANEWDTITTADRLNQQHAQIERLREALRDMLDSTVCPTLPSYRMREIRALAPEPPQ